MELWHKIDRDKHYREVHECGDRHPKVYQEIHGPNWGMDLIQTHFIQNESAPQNMIGF
jgi:hypothetical protein